MSESERLQAHMISVEFLPALGLKPVLGRNFRARKSDRLSGYHSNETKPSSKQKKRWSDARRCV